ncbi:MAG: hypothetical protein KDH94_01150 [Coxiellaceae bacterium]|nr:hypothetical protein [Coxiellaceae bacterium]
MGHEAQTKGGWLGHWIRRAIHISMVLVPWIYYHFALPRNLIWILLGLIILLEAVRLAFRFQAFGQRSHEARKISSFAWGGASLFLVLLFAPKMFAYPIIASCAFGDPLLGELRRFNWRPIWVAIVGVIVVMLVWLVAWYWLATPWWWCCIMGPLIVAAEWPNLRWIDDNAMMQLLPLLLLAYC